MRRIGFVLAAGFFCFVLASAQDKKGALSPLAGLKAWEVPYLPLTVSDSFGAADTLWLDLQKGERAGEWVLHFNVFNDESLFALSFPLRHDSLMKYDSISLAGTRLDFFQTKMVNSKHSVPNTVTVGLFSALNPEAPPLPPGRGAVMKMYFHAPPDRPINVRSVAPLMMPPGLELVTPRGAAVHPVVVRVGDATGPATEKESPSQKPSRPGRKPKG